jgi:hypothetical protein
MKGKKRRGKAVRVDGNPQVEQLSGLVDQVIRGYLVFANFLVPPLVLPNKRMEKNKQSNRRPR